MANNKELEDILQDWSFWDSIPDAGLERLVVLPAKLHADLALIVQGVRRCGKSTLLLQMLQHYDLPAQQCFVCNFEDPRLMNELDYKLLSRIIDFARTIIPAHKPCYFFLDEIQNVQGWEKWLHSKLERPQKNYFVITGSNSQLLSGEYASSLTGRHLTIVLYPFSFCEYKKLYPQNSVQDYLEFGGFPRALTYEKPKQLLQEYFNDIIYRDVIKRVNARSPDAVKQVAKMAFDSCGSELSYRKIAAVTGLTVDTVKSYLKACEEAYLLFACNFFAFSEKQQAVRQKKYYPVDCGLRHAITNTTGRDLGKSLEMQVFLRLRQIHEQVFYWQEIHKGEVDFVGVDGSKITPYQVSWDEAQQRHHNALEHFYQAFPDAQEAVFINQQNAHQFL